MSLCDTLLRSAEEPAFFRIAWSDTILEEIRRGLEGAKFGYSQQQANRRLRAMQTAFPGAMHALPSGLIQGVAGLPDGNDRHVVALAIHADADTIVTENTRDFPEEALAPHHVSVLTSDEFLVHQYHLDPQIMLEKLDRQAAGIRRQRADILGLLRQWAPRFCELCAGSR